MTAPKWVSLWYRGAAIYGGIALILAALAPSPAVPLDHYGFVFTALAFQGVFWVIGGDPARFHPIMPWTVCEKLAFGVPCVVLFAQGTIEPAALIFGLIDLVLGAGFLVAWRVTPKA